MRGRLMSGHVLVLIAISGAPGCGGGDDLEPTAAVAPGRAMSGRTTAGASRSRAVGQGSGVGHLAVASEADGRLEVFAAGAGFQVQHVLQTMPDASSWGPWQGLGRVAEHVAVGKNQDGSLELFVIGTDSALWHRRQHRPNGSWKEWASLGGWIDRLAVPQNRDGRLEVFARGSDRALYHIGQKSCNSGRWSDWEKIGGAVIDPVAVGQNDDGSLEVFTIGADRSLLHTRQTNKGHWSAWVSEGGPIDRLAVAADGHGRLAVFGRGQDRTLWHLRQRGHSHERGWTSWESLGGTVDQLAVGRNRDGTLQVFTVGEDHAVWHLGETRTGGPWNTWASAGGWADQLAVGRNRDGRLALFARGRDRSLSASTQTRAGDQQSWTAWVSLGGVIADGGGGGRPPPPSGPKPPAGGPGPECSEAQESHTDPYTGQSWNKVFYCSNTPGARLYAQPDFAGHLGYMDTARSWFVCYARGVPHAGGNDVWYYTLGDRFSSLDWQLQYTLADGTAQPWGYMPAVDLATTVDPYPGVPLCPAGLPPPVEPPPQPLIPCYDDPGAEFWFAHKNQGDSTADTRTDPLNLIVCGQISLLDLFLGLGELPSGHSGHGPWMGEGVSKVYADIDAAGSQPPPLFMREGGNDETLFVGANHFRAWHQGGSAGTFIAASTEEPCFFWGFPPVSHCIVSYDEGRDLLMNDIRRAAANRNWGEVQVTSVPIPSGPGSIKQPDGDNAAYDGQVTVVRLCGPLGLFCP